MEPKEVDIEFPRGDTFAYGFHLVDKNKQPVNIVDGETEIYFTVKKNQNTSDVIFQKKFSRDEIKFDGDGLYHTIIDADDTNQLKYGTYGYDVTIKSGEFVSTQIIGTITLTSEYTHKVNE
jgi:hypothetical protein